MLLTPLLPVFIIMPPTLKKLMGHIAFGACVREGSHFLAHLSRRLKGELIVYQSSRCLSVCVSVNIFKLNISATSGPILTKFYLNHHWGGGKAALGFGPDRIGTLVSMATDSSHKVIMGKMLSSL